jgi:hypothetical protein
MGETMTRVVASRRQCPNRSDSIELRTVRVGTMFSEVRQATRSSLSYTRVHVTVA